MHGYTGTGHGHGQDSRVGGGQGGRRGRSRRASSAAGASHRARRSADRRRRPRSTAARPRPACCLSLPFWLRRRPRGTRGCRRGAAAAMPGQLRRARCNGRGGAPCSMLARSTPPPALAGDASEPSLLAFLGGVLRQLRQRLPRPRRHDPNVITGCTCARRTRQAERDAPPTRRGKDLFVCAPGSSGGVRRTLCWGRARAGSRRPGAGHRPRTAGAQIGGGRGSPSRWRPCLTASEVGGGPSARAALARSLQLYNL